MQIDSLVMKKFYFVAFLFGISFSCFLVPGKISAQKNQGLQNPAQEFQTADVVKIIKQGEEEVAGTKSLYQIVQVKILDGKDKGELITIDNGKVSIITNGQEVQTGDTVVLQKTQTISNGKPRYYLYDKYRLTNIIYAALVFFFLVLIVAGWKGLGSVLGLSISLAVIIFYMIPRILSGASPLQVSLIASLIILLVTTYLAHGISKQTTVALFSTFLSLMLTIWIASFFVASTQLTGMTSETSDLLLGPTSHINLRGLLLAGIIIGTLGALNDITTTQSATIFSIAKHDPMSNFQKLFTTGFSVGKEHIVSMVNTLVLAYAGASLALLLFFVLNPQKVPYWVIINNEDISDEIIRTLAGSIGLILVVPIVTILAAIVCDKKVRKFFAS